MTVMPDEEEFDDFLSKVNDVEATIKGLMSGDLSVDEVDKKTTTINKIDEAAEKRKKEREKKQAEAAQKAQQQAEQRAKQEKWKEENREKLEELKQEYYLRKARRERWVEFRESNRSRAFSDYYKGWDLFEEDPDEDLFSGDNPAAVQDQAAFDAMAKDCEQRTKDRQSKKAAAEKEKERGNIAFKAGQNSEAIAAYSRAIEHFKGDKAIYCNRALAHLKQRNFISALEDCNRAIEISKFLDDDYDRRPPPAPLLKSYVRRSSANAELGHLDEATTDLDTAAAMASGSPAELEEIKRLKKTLKQDMAAAQREEEASSEDGGKGDGAGVAGATQAMRTKVRELLEALPAPISQKDAKKSEESAASDGVAEGKSDGMANLIELGTLLHESVAGRVALRQAGGVRQLLQLMSHGASVPKVAQKAALLLCIAAHERRNQLELLVCGAPTQVLRELRRLIPTASEEPDAAERAKRLNDAASFSSLAPQLRLLAVACAHEKVHENIKRMAAGEGAFERLVHVLSVDATASTVECLVSAAALLATLTRGKGGKETLVALKTPLVSALCRHLLSPEHALSEQAATALGNLSVQARLRAEMCTQGAVDALVQLVERTASGVGADALLPNALAALHNCSLLPEALGKMVGVSTAKALLPHLSGRSALARRAAALLSKCATGNKEVPPMLVGEGAIPMIAEALVSETGAMQQAAELAAKEREVREKAAKAAAEAQFAKSTEAKHAASVSEAVSVKGAKPGEDEAEAGEDEGEELLVGALVRILTACAPQQAAARAICDAGALPTFVTLLKRPSSLLQGNTALGIAECARDERCLAVLAVQQVVPPLLTIAHEGKGQAQKNAAIALGRLAKNPHCLQAIRDNHGIEILARAMKDKM